MCPRRLRLNIDRLDALVRRDQDKIAQRHRLRREGWVERVLDHDAEFVAAGGLPRWRDEEGDVREEAGGLDVHFVFECAVSARDVRQRDVVFARSLGGRCFAYERLIGRDCFESLEVVETYGCDV